MVARRPAGPDRPELQMRYAGCATIAYLKELEGEEQGAQKAAFLSA
jgi:hypothetical protein